LVIFSSAQKKAFSFLGEGAFSLFIPLTIILPFWSHWAKLKVFIIIAFLNYLSTK